MASLTSLDPNFRPFAQALVDAAGAARLLPRVTSARRSRTEQARLYRAYLAGQRAFPVASPGHSAHELGLAFDLVVSPMGAIRDVAALWTSWNGVWGAAADPVHFEAPASTIAAARSAQPATALAGFELIQETAGRFIPSWLYAYMRATSLPARAFLRAIESVPYLEDVLSFIGPAALPISILQLIAEFA